MDLWLYALVALTLVALMLQVVALVRTGARTELAALQARLDALSRENERLEREMREELATGRREAAEAARAQRDEQRSQLAHLGTQLTGQLTQLGALQNNQIDAFGQQLATFAKANEERFEGLRAVVDERLREALADQRTGREESAGTLKRFGDSVSERLVEVRTVVDARLQQALVDQRTGREEGAAALKRFGDALGERFTEVRATVETRLRELQDDNTKKLEEMRRTVDEKLQTTLEQRLGESFKLVSERLESVHRGLGEMQTLAAGVGDLKKVLTNVKTRGTWGEVQLGNLLEQVLTPDQYLANVATRPGSNDRVEFAIRMPGQGGAPLLLPIDAKFPREDYERLVEAAERADAEAVESAARDLETRFKLEARAIAAKYVSPPHTTDFALMFLPTEGLYAEALRRPGLCDTLQREHRVVVAGPTTLTALLNSLQMGFRTLAVEKRSSEIREVLGAVKTEFGLFGDVLAAMKKQINALNNTVDKAATRTNVMSRKLKTVEALPAPAAQSLLGVQDASDAGAVEVGVESDGIQLDLEAAITVSARAGD
jgi:DNA recombination protein RmuC